jgi:NADH-quinone oxidoreductase subunit B
MEERCSRMGLITEKLPGYIEHLPGGSILITSIDAIINHSRANSLWPLAFGTKCCAIEMLMATGAPHQDTSRFGAEVARQTPRQADLMVIAGAIVKKMAKQMRLLYEQMAEPRYVMATGSCAISGGPFIYNSYSIIRGADEIVPVDVYVPGCPPRPEAFFWGLLTLQKLIKEGESIRHPNIRKKPVLAMLPQGIKIEDISRQMRKLLEQENTVDVVKAAGEKTWAAEAEEWIKKTSKKP